MQLRLPTTIEGCVAATGSAENAIAHISSVIKTREQLHLIGLGGFAALNYSQTQDATVQGVIDRLIELQDITKKAIQAFQTVANIAAQTTGNC